MPISLSTATPRPNLAPNHSRTGTHSIGSNPIDSFDRTANVRFGSTPTAALRPTPPHELNSNRELHGLSRIPQLSPEVYAKLIALSNPETVTGLKDFASRVEEISRIFIEADDPRGAFPALYKVITNRAVDAIEQRTFEDNTWASKLVTDFGDLYLVNLHAHLTGQQVSPGWQRYYSLADNPGVSLERLVAVGATVHLVVDLPNSLARIDSPAERRKDFMLFGEDLLTGYDAMLAAAKAGHDIDMSEIFGLFAVGDIADAHHGEGTATRFGFQTIRRKAWLLGQMLQDVRSPFARAEVTISWRTIDGILAGLDAGNHL